MTLRDRTTLRSRPRSRIWWFFRFARAYRRRKVLRFNGIRRTWKDAKIAKDSMPVAQQWELKPIGHSSKKGLRHTRV